MAEHSTRPKAEAHCDRSVANIFHTVDELPAKVSRRMAGANNREIKEIPPIQFRKRRWEAKHVTAGRW